MVERFASVYSAGAPGARSFLPLPFGRPEARRTAVRQASARPATPGLARALLQQSEALAPCPARARNIRALGEPGTVAVVTGQQVGLFLGPLYTLYKAATAIRVAQALEAETGARTVPVFWLQTEDHDFDEIATCHVPRSDRSSRALSVGSAHPPRVSVAHRRFDAGVETALDALLEEVGNLPHAEAHLAGLRARYREGARVAEAFAGVLAHLFSAEGLVIIDPRDRALAEALHHTHRTALEEAAPLSRALRARAQALRAADFEAPVHVRDGSPLSFFHPDGPDGPRYRLAPSDGAFSLVGRPTELFSLRDLLARLESDPLSFSTSALLRPILQDLVLPTCAYIAGPGEIDYLAQVEPAYAPYGLAPPLIVPRAHFVVLEEKTVEGLRRLGVDWRELDRPEEDLLGRGLTEGAELPLPDTLHAALTRDLEERLAALAPRFDALGFGLNRAARKTRTSVERSIRRFVDKYRSALIHRDEARVTEFRRITGFLRPNGGLQERHFGLSYFAARYGERTFVERVLDAVVAFDPGMQALTL